MNIITYINIILNQMVGFQIPNIAEITDYFSQITEWSQMFAPPYFIGAIIYIFSAYAMFSLTCIFPFRLLKKLIKFPSRKGCEK